MNPYLLALTIFLAYILVLYVLHKTGTLEKLGLSLWGPFIMWRTEGGKKLIDWLARYKRFWNGYAGVAKAICLVVMLFIMGLLIWQTTLVTQIPAESAPSPEMILGIPGINPLIPIWYGILGLVVAIIVHEFAHGILTRVADLKVKSLGLIFMIVPMGAFVEPDEDALSNTTKRKRTNVFSVGPATNIILALVCALIFSYAFMAAAEPVRENPVVIQVADDGPADHAGIGFGAQVVEIDGQSIQEVEGLEDISAPDPGESVQVDYYFKGERMSTQIISGVAVTAAQGGLPAAEAGIGEGMLMASINDTVIRNPQDFQDAMDLTRPGQTVNVTVMAWDGVSEEFIVFEEISQVTLDSRNDYLEDMGREPEGEDIGFLGVDTGYMGFTPASPGVLVQSMAHPFSGADSAGDVFQGIILYMAMPFQGLAPVQSPITDLFEMGGVIGALPDGAFWIIANCFYWIFWINLMVGMTNVLPAVPLDGGYLFRDFMDGLVKKVKKGATEEDRERYVSSITYALALVVLMLIMWQIIGPRVL
ncbi:MAG: site-2 protease family protein [Methanomassiliicoccales archaeon]